MNDMTNEEIRTHLETFLGANQSQQKGAMANIMFWIVNDSLVDDYTIDDWHAEHKIAKYTADWNRQQYARELIYDINHKRTRVYRTFPQICLELGFIEAAMEAQRWINLIDSSKSS